MVMVVVLDIITNKCHDKRVVNYLDCLWVSELEDGGQWHTVMSCGRGWMRDGCSVDDLGNP